MKYKRKFLSDEKVVPTPECIMSIIDENQAYLTINGYNCLEYLNEILFHIDIKGDLKVFKNELQKSHIIKSVIEEIIETTVKARKEYVDKKKKAKKTKDNDQVS